MYVAGYGYRQATSGRPNRLVLVGIWLIFGPAALMWLFLIRSAVRELVDLVADLPAEGPAFGGSRPTSTLDALLSLAMAIGIFSLSVAILWRVTSRYLAISGPPVS